MRIDHGASAASDTVSGVVNAAIAWGLVILAHFGIEKWSDVAAVLASIYTFILICDWAWTHVRWGRKP